MSLTDFMETFKYQTLTQTDAPLGGKIDTWTDGTTFLAAITLDMSMEMRIAYQNGLKKQYTLAIPDGVTLTQDMRVKQVSTGIVYRVTSKSADDHTPPIAGIQFSQVTAEVIE